MRALSGETRGAAAGWGRVRRLLLALPAAAMAAAAASPGVLGQAAPDVDPNPCLTLQAVELRCPDLVMKRPWGLYVDHLTSRRRTLLRAGNAIDSIGTGPVELHGVRISSDFMRTRQRIYKRGGGRIGVNTGARLYFKFAHLKRRWWKFHHAARFELWRVDHQGQRTRRVRVGPKVSYCLRDLEHTRPRLRGSPRRRVYPACNTSPLITRVTVGTSIGWSDVYPPSYPEQWIDVTGLRGCFAYVHTADPGNGVYESNERNNRAQVIVRLPYKRGRQRCPGHSQGPVYYDGEY
jgi:hypothetical protein